jgi:hypothetical protein
MYIIIIDVIIIIAAVIIIISATERSESHAIHSWYMCYLSKNKLHWNQKTKNNVILSVGNVYHVQWSMHAFTRFLMFDVTQWRLPVSWKWFTRWDIVNLFGTGELGNVSLNPLNKNEVPGSVWQWTLVALVKKTSLHFDCWKTTDGLVWAGYNMTWPAWALV